MGTVDHPPLPKFELNSPLRAVAIGFATGSVVALVMPPHFSDIAKLGVMFVFGLLAGLLNGYISYRTTKGIRRQ
jgi:hypothetical protein